MSPQNKKFYVERFKINPGGLIINRTIEFNKRLKI